MYKGYDQPLSEESSSQFREETLQSFLHIKNDGELEAIILSPIFM